MFLFCSPQGLDGISPMPHEATVELGNFVAALREADLVDLKWGDRRMLCGNPLPANSRVLTLIVADEADAWIINRAKKAISRGDEDAAYAILAEITDEHRAHTEVTCDAR